jgi:hypothetical protein
MDTKATSETLLESSGGVEAAGERLEESEPSHPAGESADGAARDTLRGASSSIEQESEDLDQTIEKSS